MSKMQRFHTSNGSTRVDSNACARQVISAVLAFLTRGMPPLALYAGLTAGSVPCRLFRRCWRS